MLVVEEISFAYQNKITLNNISFSLEKGQHIAIMGESGCGKSTLLKAIYGLLDLDSGSIHYNGKRLLGPEHHLVPGHSLMKFLTQELDIMPYTTVFENVAEHLSRFYMQEREQRALELIEVVDLLAFKDIKVKNLSGGQKQRVALAKVLANEPEILLLDEPFSQIDHFRKNELRYRLFDYLKSNDISCITATHDKSDVLPFSDEVIIMKQGEIVTKNTPKEIFNNPKGVYTASLFSEVNEVFASLFDKSLPDKKIILYPNEITINDSKNGIEGVVFKCYYFGDAYILKISIKDQILTVKNTVPIAVTKTVKLQCSLAILKNRLHK